MACTVISYANENGAEFCVTLCVTRMGKNVQIADYA